jgi:hypothetical protein
MREEFFPYRSLTHEVFGAIRLETAGKEGGHTI